MELGAALLGLVRELDALLEVHREQGLAGYFGGGRVAHGDGRAGAVELGHLPGEEVGEGVRAF